MLLVNLAILFELRLDRRDLVITSIQVYYGDLIVWGLDEPLKHRLELSREVVRQLGAENVMPIGVEMRLHSPRSLVDGVKLTRYVLEHLPVLVEGVFTPPLLRQLCLQLRPQSFPLRHLPFDEVFQGVGIELTRAALKAPSQI